MKRIAVGAAVVLLLILIAIGVAVTEEERVTYHEDFEDGLGGWEAPGDDNLTHTDALAAEGQWSVTTTSTSSVWWMERESPLEVEMFNITFYATAEQKETDARVMTFYPNGTMVSKTDKSGIEYDGGWNKYRFTDIPTGNATDYTIRLQLVGQSIVDPPAVDNITMTGLR